MIDCSTIRNTCTSFPGDWRHVKESKQDEKEKDQPEWVSPPVFIEPGGGCGVDVKRTGIDRIIVRINKPETYPIQEFMKNDWDNCVYTVEASYKNYASSNDPSWRKITHIGKMSVSETSNHDEISCKNWRGIHFKDFGGQYIRVRIKLAKSKQDVKEKEMTEISKCEYKFMASKKNPFNFERVINESRKLGGEYGCIESEESSIVWIDRKIYRILQKQYHLTVNMCEEYSYFLASSDYFCVFANKKSLGIYSQSWNKDLNSDVLEKIHEAYRKYQDDENSKKKIKVSTYGKKVGKESK